MTLGGANIFGLAATAVPVPAGRRRQFNAYPGVDGLELLDLGGDGGTIQITGVHEAADLAGLAVIQQSVRNYLGSYTVYPFVDALGVTWPHCVLETFEPQAPVYRDPQGRCCQTYTMVLRSLT